MATDNGANEAIPDAQSNQRPLRYAIGLVVVHLLLTLTAVLLFLAGFQDYKWPRWQSIYLEALGLSQVSLAVTMLAIGTLSLVYRVAAAASVLMFWLIVLDALDLHHEDWLTIFAIQAAGIGACLSVARLLGAQLTAEPVAHDALLERTTFRFSTRQMLFITTTVSFLLCVGIVATKLPLFQESMDRGGLPRAKSLGIALAPIALLAVWTAFGTGRRMTPFLLLVVVTLLAGYAVSQVDRLHRTTWWSSLGRDAYPIAYLYLIGWYAVTVYASLAILRAGGFRIGRKA